MHIAYIDPQHRVSVLYVVDELADAPPARFQMARLGRKDHDLFILWEMNAEG